MPASGHASDPIGPVQPEQAEALHTYAHDLKNRVAGLLEVVRQLQASRSGDDDLLAFGEKQAFAMLQRTEQMLDDLGVPRGVGGPMAVRTAVGEIVQQAIANQDYRYEAKRQVLHLAPLPTVFCSAEPRELLAAVEALLSNASKFSQPGATVEVELITTAEHAVLKVKDSGVGLDADDLRNVFARYAWLSSRSTAGESQGRSTLAVRKRTIETMGGTLTAESDGPGSGCTFTITLPLVP